MPPYTPDELYAALIANAATLENEDAANQLASGLRAFSDIVHGMAAAADAETTSPAVHRVTAVVVSRPIVTLSSLVVSSTPFRLIVGIATLLAGLVLCFSGTFLSLDRTRRVPQRKKPRYADIEEPEKGRWAWESTGGVGGLLGGWLAGGMLSSYFSLLILNQTTMNLLSSVSFFFVWLLPSIVLGIACLRFRYLAFPLIGLIGGASVAIILTASIHIQSLTNRLILFLVFTVPQIVLPLLPYAVVRRYSLRAATSIAGAYSTAIGFSLLVQRDWADTLVFLTIDGDAGLLWNAPAWKGITAGVWLLSFAGFLIDWLILYNNFGENPDETWSKYLDDYAERGLPSSAGRAGQFTPHLSPWARLLALNQKSTPAGGARTTPSSSGEMSESGLKSPLDHHPFEREEEHVNPVRLAKFQPLAVDDDSDDEDHDEKGLIDGDTSGDLGRANSFTDERSLKGTQVYIRTVLTDEPSEIESARPSWASRPSVPSRESQATLVGSDGGRERSVGGGKVGKMVQRYNSISSIASIPEGRPPSRHASSSSYSARSHSREFSTSRNFSAPVGGGLPSPSSPTSSFNTHPPPSDWTPRETFTTPYPLQLRRTLDRPRAYLSGPRALPDPKEFAAVPATPSLIQAFDRIARGQREAREISLRGSGGAAAAGDKDSPSSVKSERERERDRELMQTKRRTWETSETKGDWAAFWDEVQDKAEGAGGGGAHAGR